jgi:20S proteasome alpha/beta subunit
VATPFYVAPEQLMKDRAEYARKGIARGRALVAVEFADGVVFAGENPSRSLHKTSEIYDRIGFAAVGRYNEFESLRVAGIRLADVKGYQYAREDVTAKPLANAYSQALGASFMGDAKPYEVELLIAEVDGDRVGTDGGGSSSTTSSTTARSSTSTASWPSAARPSRSGGARERWEDDLDRDAAVRARRRARRGRRRELARTCLEVSGLDATRPRRRFFRLRDDELAGARRLTVTADPRRIRAGARWGPGGVAAMPGGRRIFGIENEYGVTCTFQGQRRLSPDEVARYLFRRVVSWGRSSNVFLENGARLYLDVGSHPEYATPECDSPRQAVVHDKAGERIVEDLVLAAEQRLAEEGIAGRISLFKNNTDSAGNSYGCHENYLVARVGEFQRLAEALIPFLVTRQVFAGAGKVLQTPRGAIFSLAQRAEHIWEGVSSATTRSRPIINTRDEPHADAERFRRLHVIVGDSNMSEYTSWLKVATCDLVLRMLEEQAVCATCRSTTRSAPSARSATT